MTPEEFEQMQELVRANRRALQVLDSQENEVRQLLQLHNMSRGAQGQGVAQGRNPYFYGALGADGEPGVLLGDQTTTPPFQPTLSDWTRRHWTGTVQIQNDAPFVWTHLAVTGAFQVDVTSDADASFRSISQFVSVAGSSRTVTPPERFPRVDLGFVETGSGRVLLQARRVDPQRNLEEAPLLPPGLFDTQRLFEINVTPTSQFAANYTVSDQGHGPSSFFPLPDEVLLPVNGVVEVSAHPRGQYNESLAGEGVSVRISPRVYVTLIGYKILED
jgi:hypothetical protein